MDKLIDIATQEVGYLEKKSLADLDYKARNVGDNNFTKYAQELRAAVGSPFVNGVPWCAIFVDWCIFKRYGKEEAERLLHGWSMSCGEIRDRFKRAGQYSKSNPQTGDLVIFQKPSGARHIGLIYKVDKDRIYTIEGNTSGASNAVIENGGGVFKKSYLRGNSNINGYCHVDYVRAAKPTLKKGAKGNEVKTLQGNLNELGAHLDVDGSFGALTDKAVRAFQKKYGLQVDGSYGPRSAAMMRSILEEVRQNG